MEPDILLRQKASDMGTMFVVKSVACSALVFQLWEWISDLLREVKLIWGKSNTSIVKWQYYVSRYIAMAAQISNIVFLSRFHALDEESRNTCHAWYAILLAASQVLLLSLEISLLHRVYALYNRSLRAVLPCVALVVTEEVIAAYFGSLSILRLQLTGGCLPKNGPIEAAYVAAAETATQCSLWFMTFRKRESDPVPVRSRVIRDASSVFVALSMVLIAVFVHILFTNLRKEAPAGGRVDLVVAPIYMAVLSSANCRLIMNMEAMPVDTRTSDRFSSAVFTTVHVISSHDGNEDIALTSLNY